MLHKYKKGSQQVRYGLLRLHGGASLSLQSRLDVSFTHIAGDFQLYYQKVIFALALRHTKVAAIFTLAASPALYSFGRINDLPNTPGGLRRGNLHYEKHKCRLSISPN